MPGVTISSSAGGEGGFDENDRVSMRGTNPSLTQTLINGHSVASGDWFVLDQVGLVGRSVSYTLLPSEVVGQVIVRKSATADLTEGGVAGAVDIITRKPLQFTQQLTIEAAAGTVYADLPKKYDPQFNALLNWKNDANTFGVMLQGFYEKRHLRRDGQELLGYSQIAPGSALAIAQSGSHQRLLPDAHRLGRIRAGAHPPRRPDRHPGEGPARTSRSSTTPSRRTCPRPTTTGTGCSGGRRVIGTDNRMPTSYTVTNGTLTSAVFPNVGAPGANAQYAIVDQIYRPGSYSDTSYNDLSFKWRPVDRMQVSGDIGYTKGNGVTPKQDVFEGDVFNTGASLHHARHLVGHGRLVPERQPIELHRHLARLDLRREPRGHPRQRAVRPGRRRVQRSTRAFFSSVKFGATLGRPQPRHRPGRAGPELRAQIPFDAANLPAWNGSTYPGNFGSGLGGNFPRQPWQLYPSSARELGRPALEPRSGHARLLAG